VQGPS